MQNKKHDQKSGSSSSMSDGPEREMGKGKDTGSGPDDMSKKSSSGKGMGDEDDMTTSGGREGNFSDKNRGSEDQWSPGSTGSTDQ
ncbi:MAG: hypothetical protein DMF63_01960 [Acidobacteria bacterium]|nr:MAG: hypothetical protein DMF63_01960 [Acidobacteriota bacterium]